MMDKMYWACADALSLATQLSWARDLPSPDVLQRRISGLFEQMARKCRDAEIPDEDVNEARYAIAAFMDEQIFRSPWPGRQQWMSQPLQLAYFNENTAGEGFFARMQMLQQQPQRVYTLQIYYLCLALGFQGKFAVRGGEGIAAIQDYVAAQVTRPLARTDIISPHGEPKDAGRTFIRREMPIVALSIVLFGLAIIIFFVLLVIVGSNASSAAEEMQKSSGQPTAPAPSKR
jgi:type VI secretion system protein ImpK